MQEENPEKHTRWVRESILDSFANDYEEFSMIMSELGKWAIKDGETFTEDEVVLTLEMLINEGLAQAYVLSAHPPHATKVSFSLERLKELWFYVTPKGKQVVETLSSTS